MPEFDGFAARLREAIADESVSRVASRAEIGEASVRQYLAGSVPGADKAVALAKATNTNLNWLLTNTGPMRPTDMIADPRVPLPMGFDEGDDVRDFTLVPRFGVSASAGYGLVALAEEITERLAFKTDWLRDMGLSPALVGLVTCSGDSQDPIIKDGALMLVDLRPDQMIRSGNFYIVVLDGDVLVKLVNRRVDGTIELISHNPAYPKEIIDSQQLDKLTIPGRVVWAGQKL